MASVDGCGMGLARGLKSSAKIMYSKGSPDGLFAAPAGTVCYDKTNDAYYECTTGTSAWTQIQGA